MMLGDEVKDMGADYGYVWIKPLGKWYVLKNSGGDSMAKQIEDTLVKSGMYKADVTDIDINENIMEQGWESKWANFLAEAKEVDFKVLKKYLQKVNDVEEGEFDYAIDGYIESLQNSFRIDGPEAYEDFEMDDYVEDFDNWFNDRMDS